MADDRPLVIPRFFEPKDAEWWEQATHAGGPSDFALMQGYRRKLQHAAESVIHGEAKSAVQE